MERGAHSKPSHQKIVWIFKNGIRKDDLQHDQMLSMNAKNNNKKIGIIMIHFESLENSWLTGWRNGQNCDRQREKIA